MTLIGNPLALSLSKGCRAGSALRKQEGQGFDMLSPIGFVGAAK